MKSPGKINLWLKITGRRSDGYHLLHSLFAPIDLCDEMNFQQAPRDEILFSTGPIENSTVEKALKGFRKLVPKTPPLKIEIQKVIPMGGGLGGGSSNAATTLIYLQNTYGTPESKSALFELALKIGADVPFFLLGSAAIVSGIGEILEPVALKPLNLVVCRPDFGVNTKEAYGWFDESKSLTHHNNLVKSTGQIAVAGLAAQQIVDFLHNDLENCVQARHPEIAAMKEALRRRGALGSLMSGSGSSVFGIYASGIEALTAIDKLKSEFSPQFQFFSCQTI